VQIAAMAALGGVTALFGIALGTAGHLGLWHFVNMRGVTADEGDVEDTFDADFAPGTPGGQAVRLVFGQHLHSFTCPSNFASPRLASRCTAGTQPYQLLLA